TPGCALARACRPLVQSTEGVGLTGILELGWSGALLVVVCATAQEPHVVLYERNIAEAGLKGLFHGIASRLGIEESAVELLLAEGGGGDSESRTAREVGSEKDRKSVV